MISNHNELVTVKVGELVSHAIQRMKTHHLSVLPVTDSKGFAGSVTESGLLDSILKNNATSETYIKTIMENPLPMIKGDTAISEALNIIGNHSALVVETGTGKYKLLEKKDLLKAVV